MGDLLQAARDWKEAKEKQAQEVADRLRSTARANAPMLEQTAAGMAGPTAQAVLGAGTILKQGMTPTAPTAEDKPQVTLPLPAQPTTQAADQPQTFAMPTMPSGGGGTSRSSTSITEGAKLSPQTVGLLDQSGQEQRSAIREGAQAQALQNEQEADQAKRTATFQGAQQIEQQLDPAKLHISHQIDEETQKLRDLQNEKIDSKHFQKSQTLGERLGWALAMGLGGFAAGMRGGPNTAAQLYSQAIQDDIDAQRSNLSHKTDLQKGLLGDLQKRFADKQQQDAAAQIIGLNIFKTKLEAEKARTKNAVMNANADRELATTDNLLAQQHAKFDEVTSNRVTRNYESVSGGKAGGGITPEQLADKRLEIIKALQATGKPFTAQDVNNTLATMYGVGGTLPDMTKAPGGGAIDVAGIQDIANKAQPIHGKDVALAFLPSFLAPASNNAEQRMEAYRSTMRGTLKSMEPRLQGDELDRQIEAYDINPMMPDAVKKQRIDSFIDRIKASNAAKGKVTQGGE